MLDLQSKVARQGMVSEEVVVTCSGGGGGGKADGVDGLNLEVKEARAKLHENKYKTMKRE